MTRNKGTNAHLARQKALAGRFLRIKFDLTGESERIDIRISFVTEYRHCEHLTKFSGGTQKKMKLKNSHCEEAEGRRDNLLSLAP